MILIVCVDDNGGMMFNHRRQSQDRLLRQRILELAGNSRIWMNAYSARQFAESEQGCLSVDEEFLQKAGLGEYCFVEDQDAAPYEEKIEKVILYRWNRVYPRDTVFPMDLSGWHMAETAEFAGSSHEKITEEKYVR